MPSLKRPNAPTHSNPSASSAVASDGPLAANAAGNVAGGVAAQARPLLLLDIDDVLALNTHYNGRHARKAVFRPDEVPPDLYEKLFSMDAVETLNRLLLEFRPRVVLTTSWLMLLTRDEFLDLFRRTGVNIADGDFHAHWDAPEDYGVGRAIAIAKWLADHHQDENFLILDDVCSGATLVDSPWQRAGHVVLCLENVGFHDGLLDAARTAMQTPFLQSTRWKPWELKR